MWISRCGPAVSDASVIDAPLPGHCFADGAARSAVRGDGAGKCSVRMTEPRWHGSCSSRTRGTKRSRLDRDGTRSGRKGAAVNSIFYIIGVVVVVLFVLGYFGLR